MENASKALLIAGSILIVILLIAMGVKVFNSTKGTTDSAKATMDTTTITMFNNKFTQYAGKRQSAAKLRALADIVIAHNAIDETNQVSFMGETDATIIVTRVSELSGFYTIYVKDTDRNGLIDYIEYYLIGY